MIFDDRLRVYITMLPDFWHCSPMEPEAGLAPSTSGIGDTDIAARADGHRGMSRTPSGDTHQEREGRMLNRIFYWNFQAI